MSRSTSPSCLLQRRGRAASSLTVALLLLLASAACSSSEGTTAASDAPAADGAAPDSSGGTSSDVLPGDLPGDSPGNADNGGPLAERVWQAIPLGASGDLLRVRHLGRLGFRVTGVGGTILRRQGLGWVREWAPADAPEVHDAAAFGEGAVAVGAEGTWLVRSEGTGAWQEQDPGVTVDLLGVEGLLHSAVGVGAKGMIVRWDGESFGQELSGITTSLRAVRKTSGDSAYAVGDVGMAVRRVASPAPCEAPAEPLCAPCGEDAECGERGKCVALPGETEERCTVLCGGGREPCPKGFVCNDPEEGGHCVPRPSHTWIAQQASPSDVSLRDLFVLDSSTMWAVGGRGTIMRYDGSQWKLELSNDAQKRALHGVHGGAGFLVAAGEDGLFLRRESTAKWSLVEDIRGPLLGAHSYFGVAQGATRVVAAGEDGALQVKELPDGPFVDEDSAPFGAVRDLAFSGERGAAVGDDGLLVLFGPDGYGAYESGTDEDLLAVCAADESIFFAAGRAGTLLAVVEGVGVDSVDTGVSDDLHGIVKLASGEVLAVGVGGTALRLDSNTGKVSVEPTPDARDLHDVFLDAAGVPTAVGQQGAFLLKHGDTWVPQAAGTSLDLLAGASGGGRNVVAGAHGVVLAWADGEEPAALREEPGTFYYAVEVDEAGYAAVAGWAGAFLRVGSDGGVAEVEGPTRDTLYALARRGGDLVAGGDSGGVWAFVEAPAEAPIEPGPTEPDAGGADAGGAEEGGEGEGGNER